MIEGAKDEYIILGILYLELCRLSESLNLNNG